MRLLRIIALSLALLLALPAATAEADLRPPEMAEAQDAHRAYVDSFAPYRYVCNHIKAADIEYLSRNPAGFDEHCARLIQPVWDKAPPGDRYRDSVHLLFVVACESGFDVDANTRRWGTGTMGLLAFMRYLHWDERIYGKGSPEQLAFDAYDTTSAATLAAIMIYDGVNARVNPPNFWWWWSCARSYGRPFEAIFGRGTAPETRYCPPPSYWKNVPPGSNFRCGGVDY